LFLKDGRIGFVGSPYRSRGRMDVPQARPALQGSAGETPRLDRRSPKRSSAIHRIADTRPIGADITLRWLYVSVPLW
jgi:hypothetical protein